MVWPWLEVLFLGFQPWLPMANHGKLPHVQPWLTIKCPWSTMVMPLTSMVNHGGVQKYKKIMVQTMVKHGSLVMMTLLYTSNCGFQIQPECRPWLIDYG